MLVYKIAALQDARKLITTAQSPGKDKQKNIRIIVILPWAIL